MEDCNQWHVRLFGPLRIDADGAEVRNPTGKARSLLAYLLLYPAVAYTREQIMDALWPDLPFDRARRTLSDALYRLRETPIGQWIQTEGEKVALQRDPALWVDVWDFAALTHSSQASDLDRALALATGPLLPEIYDDWIIARRTALQEDRLALLHRRADLAEQQNDLALAHALYQQIVDSDNLDEVGWRGWIRCLARMGHQREALDIFQRLARVLDEELGVPPEAESVELANQIRREHEAQRTAGAELSLFVGRTRERSQLVASLDTAIAGRGALSLVLADAGMGRTALLHEIAQSARWRGVQVVWGRGSADIYPQPYAPLRDALVDAIPEARAQQLRQMMREQWLDTLHLLLGDAPPGAGDAAATAASVRSMPELALAIANTLHALGQIAPHLFLLDDMQWADRSLWDLFDELRHYLAQSRILLVLSSRLTDIQSDSDIHARIATWERAGAISVHTLPGLSLPEISQVLRHHRLLPADEERLAAIHEDTGGNPLLALTLASLAEDSVDTTAFSMRDDLAQNILLRRFHLLPPPEREALEICAVLGAQFTWRSWAALWNTLGKDLAELPILAGRLEQRQHLRLEGAHYRFSSSLLQSAIHAQIAPERLQLLHRLALTALESIEVTPASLALRHAQLAGMREKTFHYALLTGEVALAAFAHYSARDAFTLALAHAPEDDLAARYEVYLGRSQALGRLGLRNEERADLEALAAHAEALDDDTRRTTAASALARFLLAIGALDDALAAAHRALEYAARAQLTGSETRLHETIAAIYRERKQIPLALQHIEEARRAYLARDDQWGLAHVIDFRGGLAWDVGDYRSAEHDHLEAANLFSALGDIVREGQVLNNLGSTYWELGDYAGARTTHERALLVCRAAGDKRGEADNIDNLGGVYWSLGDYDTAIEHYTTALQMRRAIRDEWGVSISLGNLGSALLRQGNPHGALAYYQDAYPLYQKIGRRRSEGYVLHNIGIAHHQLGDTATALRALQEALVIREEVGDLSKVIETHAALAQVQLAQGDEAGADASMQAALALLQADSYPHALQQEVHYAAFEVAAALGDDHGARQHLGSAELAMASLCASLPAESQDIFLANVPLNRQVSDALAAYAVTADAQCARADAPRGRALRADEQVKVHWTLATPGDELITDPAQRRRRVLRRLLDEASRQGAAPTDDALATTLNVSRRTILRDVAALEAEGIAISTRFRTP